jgi:hypothetical protein
MLRVLEIEDVVLAYRRLVSSDGKGKNNIHFAGEAFEAISSFKSCCVITLDISDFFGSINHDRLKATWQRLLKANSLPAGHRAVFRNLTNFKEVDRDECYVRLGLAEWESVGLSRRLKMLKRARDLPKQLCKGPEFRKTIASSWKGLPKLISANVSGVGIPQGAPLSDLLANAYLMDFDVFVKNYLFNINGIYRRYSDDIMIIVPWEEDFDIGSLIDIVVTQLTLAGSELKIKAAKTSVHLYGEAGGKNGFRHLQGKGLNGLEYLGFRFDGSRIYIKDTTISRLYRNIIVAARSEAYRTVARYPDKTASECYSRFDLAGFMARFGRVADFDSATGRNSWTFWTYASRCVAILKPRGAPIAKQLSDYKSFVRDRVLLEIERAFRKAL